MPEEAMYLAMAAEWGLPPWEVVETTPLEWVDLWIEWTNAKTLIQKRETDRLSRRGK